MHVFQTLTLLQKGSDECLGGRTQLHKLFTQKPQSTLATYAKG